MITSTLAPVKPTTEPPFDSVTPLTVDQRSEWLRGGGSHGRSLPQTLDVPTVEHTQPRPAPGRVLPMNQFLYLSDHAVSLWGILYEGGLLPLGDPTPLMAPYSPSPLFHSPGV